MQLFRIAAFALIATSVVATACVGDDPPFNPGPSAPDASSADSATSSTDGGANDGARPGEVTLSIQSTFPIFPIADIPIVATYADGTLTTLKTDAQGPARIPFKPGTVITARIESGGFTRLVTFTDVEAGDSLSVNVAQPNNDALKLTVEAVPNVSNLEYSATVCGELVRLTPGVPLDVPMAKNPCRIMDGRNPIFFAAKSGSGSELYNQYQHPFAGAAAATTLTASQWKETRTLPVSFPSDFPITNTLGYVSAEYLKDDTSIRNNVIFGLNKGTGAVLLVPASGTSILEWERSIYSQGPSLLPLYRAGSIVREQIPGAVVEDPSLNFPLISTLVGSGRPERPTLDIQAPASLENAHGVEVVLDNGSTPATATFLWILRMGPHGDNKKLALPELPASIRDGLPLAGWTHAQATIFRYESFGDARIMRAVPSFFRPRLNDRITERLQFPTDTKLRFTSVRSRL